MRTTHKWTGPELRQIQAAADAGMTRREAAEALGITPAAIAYAVQHYRVLFRRERPGPRIVATWDRQQEVWR